MKELDNNAVARFLLTFFLGFIGSFVVNIADLAPNGYKSRTFSYFIWGTLTFGIYSLVASICNFTFDPNKPRNIGLKKMTKNN
ncbi:MAG: hypothetical protein LBU60_05405 [Clostridiales bacterium]|jgi:hypothetical protein|nr:hypothetical protein [Clostridiales bacterium]